MDEQTDMVESLIGTRFTFERNPKKICFFDQLSTANNIFCLKYQAVTENRSASENRNEIRVYLYESTIERGDRRTCVFSV